MQPIADQNIAGAIIAAESKFGDTIPSGTYVDMAANLPLVDPVKVLSPVLLSVVTDGLLDACPTTLPLRSVISVTERMPAPLAIRSSLAPNPE